MRRCPVTTRAVQAGDLLLRLQGPETTNGWLLAGAGWVPPTRIDPLAANARWQVTFCPACDQHVASLHATIPLNAQQEVVCRAAPFPDVDTIRYPYEVTFDGGARRIDSDRKVAGAGATLWHFPPDGGEPQLLASTVVALPGCDNAQVAEATGCRAALALLAHTHGRRAARVVGDNLAVVRYGAGTGRFQRVPLQAQMELSLGPLAQRGWALQWHAVRRRLNKAADRLATLGVFWAASLARRGDMDVRTHTVWHARPLPPVPLHFPDAAAASLLPHPVQFVADRLEDLARSARAARRTP